MRIKSLALSLLVLLGIVACGSEEQAQNADKKLDLSIPDQPNINTPQIINEEENKLPNLFNEAEAEKKLTVKARPMLAPIESVNDKPKVEGATMNIELKTQ